MMGTIGEQEGELREAAGGRGSELKEQALLWEHMMSRGFSERHRWTTWSEMVLLLSMLAENKSVCTGVLLGWEKNKSVCSVNIC